MSVNKKKKAVVVGPYRVHNFGDDLVGAIIAKRLQQSGYSVSVPRLGLKNAEWLGAEYRETYDGVFDDADLIVLGGGGIMSDTSGAKPGASYLDIIAKAAIAGQMSGKRFVITSIGAGPWLLEKSKMLAFGVSLLANKIGVRDKESFDHLASLGVKGEKVVLGADCALLSADFLDFKPAPNGKIGIQFDTRIFDSLRKNPNLNLIRGALREFIEENDGDVLLISNGESKSPLAKTAPGADTLEYSELEDFLPRLAGLRSMFTSHLHLAITAYSQRIPTFSLFVREKTKRFYSQIGRPERAIDLSTASLRDFEKLMVSAQSAVWTDQDEETLQKLQREARSLLSFVA